MPAKPEPARSASPLMELFECPECSYVGISGVTGGVGPWPGDGKVRCPSSRCEYRTVMEPQSTLVTSAEVARTRAAYVRVSNALAHVINRVSTEKRDDESKSIFAAGRYALDYSRKDLDAS